MAEQPILHSEIIEIDRTIAGIQKIIKELKNLQAQMQKTAKETIGFQQKQDPSTPAGKKGTQKVTDETAALTKKNQKLADSIKEVTKEQTRLKKARRDALTEQRRQIQVMDSAKGSLDRNRVALQKLTERYNRAAPAAAKKMQSRVLALTNTIKQQESAIGRNQRNVGNYPKVLGKATKALSSFGAGMLGVTAVIGTFSRLIRAAKKNSEEFETGLTTVLTLLDKAQVAEMGGMLKVGADKVIKKYGLAVDDASKALFDAISAGVEAGEAIEFLDAAARLAVGGNSDLSSVVLGITKIMNAYNLEASDAVKISEALFAAQKVGQTTVQELAASIGSSTGIAQQAGIGYDELLSTFAVLTKRLKNTDETATAINATITALINPATDAKAAFEAMGIETGIMALRNNGLFATLVQITNATGENADALTELIPNIRALKGVGSLTAEALLEYDSTLKLVNDETGAATLLTDALTMQMKTHSKTMDVRGAKVKSQLRQDSRGSFFLNLLVSRQARKIAKDIEETGVVGKKTDVQIDNLETQKKLDAIEKQRLANIRASIALKTKELDLDVAKQIDAAIIASITVAEEKTVDVFVAYQQMLDDELAALEEEIDKEIALYDKRAAADGKSRDKAAMEEEKAKADKKRGQQAVLGEAANLAFALTDLKMSKLEQEKQQELALAGDNEAKILEIEKKYAKEKQKVAITQALIDSSLAIVKTLASVVFPFNVIAAGIIAATAGVQVAAIRSQTFAEGGHGELGGERHAQGGTPIPGIGEAERGEYFGIINRSMTQKYRKDLPAIFDSLNSGRFHDVWSNANIQLQTEIDPWTKKMYTLMSSTANIYTDSKGDTVKEYPSGRKIVIHSR